ncbi:DUF448 domain-containing protein [Deinococcus radiophilus]|uniref:DUF448 domain-containing protein n=1 Tax=Deinococcus radiophilus TaxID=32062 RepID=UPI00361BB8BC
MACRRVRPQAELLRLSAVAQGWAVTLPGERRLVGRGRYLCADTPGCWAEKRLRRAFGKQAASLSEALLARPQPEQSHEPDMTNPLICQ